MTPWIKMRTDLLEDPRVGRLSSILGCEQTHVIGGLYVLWSLADRFSVDGTIPHLVDEALDARSGLPGFSDALRHVGWLETAQEGSEGSLDGLRIPRFDEHNGQSAKRRSQDAARKSRVRSASASKADKKRHDVEQSRAEQEEEQSKKIKAVLTSTTDSVGSKGAGTDLNSQLFGNERFRRAFEMLTNDGGISSKNKPEAVRYLLEITKKGHDPAAIMVRIITNAKKAVNKGGYVFSSLREEAKG